VAAELEIVVTDAVPDDLAVTVAATPGPVVVRAQAPAALVGDALAGWEIGVATAALLAGAAGVEGIAPERVRRVRAVVDALGAAEVHRAPEVAR
jgi:hypothetical protein